MSRLVTARGGAEELVPLAERARYLLAFRMVAAGAVVGFVLAVPPAAGFDAGRVAVIAGVYVVLSAAVHLLWRTAGKRALLLLAAALLLDGLFLATAAYLTGGVVSPLRHLVLVHLAMVSLLASYRTGLKLALWHTLLLFVTYRLEKDGFLAETTQIAGIEPTRAGLHLAGYVGALWLIALTTATFSSVNERELRRRRYDLEALALLASNLESAHSPHQVGDELVRAAADVVGANRALLLADRPDGTVQLLASIGVEEPADLTVVVTPSSVVSHSHAERRPALSAGLAADDDPWLVQALPAAGNLIVLPLTVDGRPVGTLVVEHDQQRSSRVERRVVSILERFASQTALALRGAWLLETVQAQAAQDGLTGVANRRSFDLALDLEVQRARRGAGPVSLILFDIDHFKVLNDTYGHQAGDQVLCDVATTLRQHCRDIDTVARYGGEEFAAILPQCGDGAALQTANRLLVELSLMSTIAPVTASAGVATWGPDFQQTSELLAVADAALFRSKRAGRNRATAGILPPAVADSPEEPYADEPDAAYESDEPDAAYESSETSDAP